MRFTGLGSDLRFAFRLVCADWRFSATLVATLAVGIAASGALFNVVNATLLRPLPIPDEARVYRLQDYTIGRDGEQVRRSNRVLNFLDIREQARGFSQVIGMRSLDWSLIDGETPVPVAIGLVSPRSFELLGVRAAQGRLFTEAEERAGLDANVVVLSHALWQRQFAGRPDVLGRTVRVDERMVSVVGILGPGFRFPYDVEAWMPEQVDRAMESSLAVFARLAPGVARAQAQSDLDGVARLAEAARPVVNRGVGFAMTPIRESLVGETARTSLALLGGAALLLVLASANVANLLLARGIRRAREIAVRAALGADRARQVRQMLVESVLFAVLGTVAGLAIAHPVSTGLVGLVPNTLRDQLGLTDTTVDMRAALFAAAVTAAVGVLAGLVPALELARADVSDTLRQHTRGASSGHRPDAIARRRRGGAGGGPAGQRGTDDREPAAAARREPGTAGGVALRHRPAAAAALRHRRATGPGGAPAPRGSARDPRRRTGGAHVVESHRPRQLRRLARDRGSAAGAGAAGVDRQPSAADAGLDDGLRRHAAARTALHRRGRRREPACRHRQPAARGSPVAGRPCT